MTARAKKITGTASHIVVLEEWQSPVYPCERCRVIYDAELNAVIGQLSCDGDPWREELILSAEWRAMP